MNVRRSLTGAKASVLAAALLAPGCGQKPAEIRVTPPRTTLYGIDRKSVLKAEVLDKKGRPLPQAAVGWQSAKPAVASVDREGVVKSVSPGRTIVTAQYGRISATTPVDVVDVASVTLFPSRGTLVGSPGSRISLNADVKDSKGNPVSLSPKWTVADPNVARVDASGNVLAVKEGRTTVMATIGDFAGACDLKILFREIGSLEIAPLTVLLKPGEVQRINATVRDTAGNAIEEPVLSWSSSDPKVATCSAGGVITAISRGSVTVQAILGPRVARASVLVN